MGIFSRFTDIVNSNLNAMLDKAEDPSKMIRLIIQEMEETLVEVRSSSARIIADKKEASRKLSRLEEEALGWEKRAKLAITKGREDLARSALAEKAVVIEEKDIVSQELQALEDHLITLNDEVAQLQVKLDDARAKQKAMVLRAQTVENRYRIKRQIHSRNVNDAFAKFETFERRLDDLEGQVESYDLGKKDLATEIDDLANDDTINSELERLKQELNESSPKS
ncbi:Phage shock protein A [Thalassocella blandensis]|nr:Phage shock protein A [Thalassocella blandensis]